MLGGSFSAANDNAVLITPAAPAAITMWPTLLLSEPMRQKPSSSVPRRKARVRASSSTGSPSGVAVPWVSTYEIDLGPTPAASSAAATTAAWPSTLGAVKLAFRRPSLLTATPRITACTVSPSANASVRRFSSTTVAPSLNTVPCASASKLRVRPSGESIAPSWYR